MLTKKTMTILTLVVMSVSFAATQSATGQTHIPGPRYRHQPIEQADATRPFAEPGVFNYDAQVFAPLEFTNDKQKEPYCGFFFTFDRTYMSVRGGGGDAQAGQANHASGDYMWGNRYEIGYMTDADHGWDAIFWNSSGADFANGRDILISNPTLINTKFASFELNKIFRQHLSDGRYMEPYLGLRHYSLSDTTLEDTSQNIGGVQFPNRFKQQVTNSMTGIHAGGKYVRRTGRWHVSVDGSLAATYNNRNYFATDLVTNGAAIGVAEADRGSSSFVPAVDFGVEMAYNVTRDISLRTGVTALYLWDGIARADTRTTTLNPNSNFGTGGTGGIFDQSTSAIGFNFGFEWRR